MYIGYNDKTTGDRTGISAGLWCCGQRDREEMSRKPYQQWKINRIWKGVNDFALRVDKGKEDSTMFINYD